MEYTQISQPVCLGALIVLTIVCGIQIYSNQNSGIVLALVGSIGGMAFATLWSYGATLSIVFNNMEIVKPVMAFELIISFAFIFSGFWLSTRHTKEVEKKAAKAALEKKQLEEKAKKADGGILTNLFRG